MIFFNLLQIYQPKTILSCRIIYLSRPPVNSRFYCTNYSKTSYFLLSRSWEPLAAQNKIYLRREASGTKQLLNVSTWTTKYVSKRNSTCPRGSTRLVETAHRLPASYNGGTRHWKKCESRHFKTSPR